MKGPLILEKILPDTPIILIVDDKPSMRYSLKKLLRGNNYEIHTGCDGREATELLSRMNVDIVLLYIMMPLMDGFQVMDYMEDQGLNSVVVAITGDASVESSII